jgi:uncharacterized NAD(P)/FAD-binding protein YdhS
MHSITIIGGGASGTLLAANLLRNANNMDLTVNIVEKRGKLGQGVAYSTPHLVHLLNVPAAKMGAFPDDIGDFHKWLAANGYGLAEGDFVPRTIFGKYLTHVLYNSVDNSPASVNFNYFDDEAEDVIDGEASADVVLNSGKVLHSDIVVLAFGNFLPPHPNVPDNGFTSAPTYFRDQWDASVYSKITPDDTILIIGTGLSMVDLAMHFNSVGHRGKISAISTRGLLPAVHAQSEPYPSFYEELKGSYRVTDLLKTVRRHIKKAELNGGNWRGVIDSLRPHTQQIWRDLPTAEKRYFMEHLSRYWNVSRHRMPPAAAAVLANMQANKTLEVFDGRLKQIELTNDHFLTTYRTNGSDRAIMTDAVINCIGSESNFERIDSRLIKNLINSGSIKNDDLSLGIAVGEKYCVIGADGNSSPRLKTIGTAMKGTLWETTAIPEIRHQAKELALQILAAF